MPIAHLASSICSSRSFFRPAFLGGHSWDSKPWLAAAEGLYSSLEIGGVSSLGTGGAGRRIELAGEPMPLTALTCQLQSLRFN